MARLNWHDRVLAYMAEHGFVERPTRSYKQRRFGLSVPGEKYRQYVVTPTGAVRRELLDERGNVVGSLSVAELFKKYVAAWEQKQVPQRDV